MSTNSKPAVKKTAPAVAKKVAPAKKAAPAAPKSDIAAKLKDAAKTTASICEAIAKANIGKDEIMKLVEILDGMGTATFNTACALRDLYNRM